MTPEKTGDGKQALNAEIVWRWRPNWVGQTFDPNSEVFRMLPDKARGAAASFGLDSRQELLAFANLESNADGWKVVEIYQFNGGTLNEVVPAD